MMAAKWERAAHHCKSLRLYISSTIHVKADCYKLKIYTINPKITTKITKLKILANKQEVNWNH